MITKQVAKKLLKLIRNNSKQLIMCDYPHDFSIKVGNKWKCSKCEGVVDRYSKMWYERGLKHSNNKIN